MARFFSTFLMLVSLVAALPAFSAPSMVQRNPQTIPAITEAMIVSIAPGSATCDSALPNQCTTAKTLASVDLVNLATKQWGLTTKGEVAAVIATMAIDSGEFKLNHDYGPGEMIYRGTTAFIFSDQCEKYAQALSPMDADLKAKFDGLVNIDENVGQHYHDLINLLNSKPEWAIGAGFWHLSAVSPSTLRDGLKTGTPSAWTNYITSIKGGALKPADMQRMQGYWDRACNALGGCE